MVHVSIANWVKGPHTGKKSLIVETGPRGRTALVRHDIDHISSSLSLATDVTQARPIRRNSESHACYQGQTHGHPGFLLKPDEAQGMLKDTRSRGVLHPYLTGDNLLGNDRSQPSRLSIDLNHCEDVLQARKHRQAYRHVEAKVLPTIEGKASEERAKTGKSTGPRQNHLRRWWRFWRGRREMIDAISQTKRYIACARVTKRPVFEFISSEIRPNDALQVFPLNDDYSFGILQSGIHWLWFTQRCSTLKDDPSTY